MPALGTLPQGSVSEGPVSTLGRVPQPRDGLSRSELRVQSSISEVRAEVRTIEICWERFVFSPDPRSQWLSLHPMVDNGCPSRLQLRPHLSQRVVSCIGPSLGAHWR